MSIDRSYLSQVERGRAPGNALRTRFFLLEKSSSVKPRVTAAAGYDLRNVPVLSWTQAGQMINPAEIPAVWDEVVPSDAADGKAFGVRLRGDSMEPRFSEGDIAVVLPGTLPTNGDTVIANLKNQGLLCKITHVQLDKNFLTLSSYNPAYPPTTYRRDDFHWIFPVTTVIKQLLRP